MTDLKSTKAWHIQNLIQVDDDCQVVLLCDALALEKERNELAAQVERLRGAITPKVIDLIRCGIGSNYSGPLFDNTMNEYREPLVLALSETPPAALAKLKAQCQAEGALMFAGYAMVKHRYDFCDWADSFADEIRQRAQEAGDVS